MATLLPLGQLEAFDPQVETFTSYVERVHLFFEANDIKEEKGHTTSRHNCRP